MPQRIGAPCRRDFFPAARSSGTRPDSSIRLVVWHDTEGGSAGGIAGFFRGSTAQGSAHIVVDDGACYRCLDDNQIPWGAPGVNTTGLHIEQCGFASWSKARWLLHQPMLHRTAYKTARWCLKYNIPVRFVDAAGLKAGLHGITTHAEASLAFTPGGHTDPGPNYPKGHVITLTKMYKHVLKRIGA